MVRINDGSVSYAIPEEEEQKYLLFFVLFNNVFLFVKLFDFYLKQINECLFLISTFSWNV